MTDLAPTRLPVGRRSILRAGAVGAAGALLAACGGAGVRGLAEVEAFRSTRDLRILNWSDYIDPGGPDSPGTVALAREAFEIDIRYEPLWEDNAGGWAEFIEPVFGSGRPPTHDIITPTFWVARRMLERGWIRPLPLELIPNHANIDPAYLTLDWDRGAAHQMPWQAGITGIAYDPALTGRPLNSIEDLFDPELAGRVGFIGEMSEAVGMMMLANGHDPSRPTEETTTRALDRIEFAVRAGQIGAFTFNEFTDQLADGTLAAAMAWSGDTVQLQLDRPDMEFIIPEEGAIRWFDTMVISDGSPNVANAAKWMNYVYEPEVAARITSFVQYISPVLGVRDALDDLGGESAALAENPILFPDDETAQRLFTWGGDEALDTELEARFAEISNLQ